MFFFSHFIYRHIETWFADYSTKKFINLGKETSEQICQCLLKPCPRSCTFELPGNVQLSPTLVQILGCIVERFTLISEKRVCGTKNDKIYLINLLLDTFVAGRKEKNKINETTGGMNSVR